MPTPLIKPKAIGRGSRIGVAAPANHLPPETIAKGQAVLEKMGFEVFIHPQCYKTHYRNAGTAQERGDAINDLFADPQIDAILLARGGSGCMRTEAHLNYDLIANNPKIFCGFSDHTFLLHSIHNKTGLVTFHGPMLQNFAEEDGISLAHFVEVLGGNVVSLDLPGAQTLTRGTAQGHLTGGNLVLLGTLLGTPHAPQTDGSILFIEEVSEEYYAVDRLLWHLKNAGKLHNIKGIMLGELVNVTESKTVYGITPQKSVLELFQGQNIPIVGNVPCGHGKRAATLPIGIPATLTVRRKGAALTLNEAAVTL